MLLIFSTVILSVASGLLILQLSRNSKAATGGIQYGIVTGSDTNRGVNTAASLGIRLARFFEIGRADSPTLLDAQVLNAARKGVEPIILIDDSNMGRTTEAGNAGAVAARFGKGGTFWQTGQPGAGYEQYAPRWIEWGNETSYTYGNKPGGSAGGIYGRSALAAAQAMKAANPNIGLLVQGEDGDSLTTTWLDTMFAAVPNIHTYVAGWTVHPYGPQTGKMDRMVTSLASKGVTSAPIFITEDGISTDNGRTLSNNYGWPTNLTYDQASATMTQKINFIKSKSYASQIRVYMQFQANDQRATGTSTNREHYFGILRSDDSAKGNYTNTVINLASQHPRDNIPPVTSPPPPSPSPSPQPQAPSPTTNNTGSSANKPSSSTTNNALKTPTSGATASEGGGTETQNPEQGSTENGQSTTERNEISTSGPLSQSASQQTTQKNELAGGLITSDEEVINLNGPIIGNVQLPKKPTLITLSITSLFSIGLATTLLQRRFGLFAGFTNFFHR